MAKISPCFKRTFVFFNSLFAIFGIVAFILGLILHQYVEEPNGLYAIIVLYVTGSVIFIFAVLGAYGANKESKCALIVFFVLMCLATAGMLRLAIPVVMSKQQIISTVGEYISREVPLTKEKEHVLNPIQAHFQCCGLVKGYKDWLDEVPASCNCMSVQGASCDTIDTYKIFPLNLDDKNQRVWSQPCGPVVIEYIEKVIVIMIAVCFSLAALAILGGLMSIAMIIRITAPAHPHLPSLPLSYQPPKYSEVMNY